MSAASASVGREHDQVGPGRPATFDHADEVFSVHRRGKMSIAATVSLRDAKDLSLSYTPGVARVCAAIAEDAQVARDFTWVSNAVAVVTDGTAVLGLGDIGPRAAMPVMEGKAILFKQFAGIDAVPITLGTTDVDEIVSTIVNLAPSFGGINLEDIAAPRCFEIERRLVEALDIPVFHDDQHGTAIVTLAALHNAVHITGRDFSTAKVVISGAGAAGVAVESLLRAAGVSRISVADSHGVITPGRTYLTPVKQRLADRTAGWARSGTLEEALVGADVFIGVSGGSVCEDAIASMAPGAVIFALANPTPEVDPTVASRHARVVATGRSDFPNQVNNALVFPGLFRGALNVRATSISTSMKLAAAEALANVVGEDLRDDYIIPSVFDPRVATAVADAVMETALREGRVHPAA